jgi:glycosyltransferase involved in cell wall biosynthesis
MRPVVVTTSWDDGHKLDIKLASLLKSYGIQGTFYVSPQTREFPVAERLTAEDIRQIAQDFEIGAHTMTHPHLDRLDATAARREILDSKETLELILGEPLRSFCYPYGDYNDETRRIVEEAGFSRARTVRRFMTRSVDRLALGTSVDTFDHRRDGILSVLRLCGRRPWKVFRLRRWDNLAKAMFMQARERGEVFHLWGHSREIEADNNWGRLEAFLAWLKEQDVISVRNGEIETASPRVLVTAPYFKPRSGGLEEYAYQITKGLQEEKGWKAAVVASGNGDEVKMESYQGLKTYYLPHRLRFSNTPFGFGWHRALKRIIAAERPDVLVAHAPVPGMLDATVGLARKIPLVVTYHSGSMVKGNYRWDLLIRCYEGVLLPRALRKASWIVCSSAFVQRSAPIRRHGSKSTVIHPGVDADLFALGTKRVAGHAIMHVGGLKAGEQYKGLDISLRVTAKLKCKYPDAHLTVVGNGDRQAEYQMLAENLGVAEQVEFRGRLNGAELATAYQSADVLITPSRKESFGMVIVEAMACGVPVVASAAEGIPDVLDDGEVGFLVEPDDVDGFVDRISELFDDAALSERLSQNARRAAAAAEYAWPGQIELTAQLLEKLI